MTEPRLIGETGPERNLARSADGRVIHTASCRHARVPWPWADTATDDELWQAKIQMGYKVCRVCCPSWIRRLNANA